MHPFAAVTGASFIRVNVHTGIMVTDQGLIEGRARDTLLLRRFNPANLLRYWALADGFIVGTSLKRRADSAEPVDIARVRRLTAEAQRLAQSGT